MVQTVNKHDYPYRTCILKTMSLSFIPIRLAKIFELHNTKYLKGCETKETFIFVWRKCKSV